MPDSNAPKSFKVRIRRQDEPKTPSYWQEFEIPYKTGHNIISVLQYIAANPVTTAGQEVAPPVWQSSCLEEVCGACTMVVNGRVRQSCSTLVDELLGLTSSGAAPGGAGHGASKAQGHASHASHTITVEPMTKFPVVRDLWVDRQRMFNNLVQIKGWVPIDGTHDLGPGPQESPEKQEERYDLSRCMTCGCCLEACPQFTIDNDFVGAQTFGLALYFNEHETGKRLKDDRLDALMGPGGITDCGNAQNCAKVCPKEIPLTEAIGKIGRQTTARAIKRFFSGK